MSQDTARDRAKALLSESDREAAVTVDRLFVVAFFVQWLACLAFAFASERDDDLVAAGAFGAAIALVPIGFVLWRPGGAATRHAVALTQMLYGALFVHLSGAKLGTSLHVFASLAFLSLYRDWRVIATASALVGLHVLTPLATFHAPEIAWALATGAFLLAACVKSERERLAAMTKQVELEALRTNVSHDIRTPMTAILGAAELLLDPRRREDPRSQVRRIHRNGAQLLSALNGLVAPEDAPPAVIGTKPEPVSALQPKKLECSVLVVEDSADTQKIVKEYLQRAGCHVHVVENGQLALDAVADATAEGEPFDLILMDMGMPVMDGYAATTELRRRGYGGPILALTARALPGDRARCINAGCTEYLTKPITRERLVQAVATHALGSAATIPPGLVSVRQEELIYSDYAGDDDMAELLDGFVTRLAETTARIEAAAATNDHAEVERLAQRLRGAAASYGFPAISEAAEAVEKAAKEGADIGARVAALGALCRRARARSFASAA